MKKGNLTTVLILGCMSLFCNPKTERKQTLPKRQNYNTYQNYKFDDDELQDRNTKKIKETKQTLQTRLKK